jgi:methyl-accepting chemotaxis protein
MKNRNILQRISTKLFIALFVPVALLIVFGVVSSNKSQTAIISNYENSAEDTMNALSDYINFALGVIEKKSFEYQQNLDILDYFSYSSDDILNSNKFYRKISSFVALDETTNKFISKIFMFGAKGKGVGIDVVEDFYPKFLESELAKKMEASKGFLWVGSHEILDEVMSTHDNLYNSDDYALSIIRNFKYEDGYIIIDIVNQELLDMFVKYDMGDGSILALVTNDGKEIMNNPDNSKSFIGTEYYKAAIIGEALSGQSYVDYKGEKYLFLFSKIVDVDAMLCALIPEKAILNQVKDIKQLNFAFVSFASIFALVTGIFIAVGISRAIELLKKSIDQASKGDLTTHFNTKRKDEFLVLSKGIGTMLHDMRKVIRDVFDVGSKVSNSAEMLSGTSRELLVATKDISLTIDNIQQGIVQQASDTENCLLQMTNLSNQINHVYSNTHEIETIASNTEGITMKGIVLITDLNDKSKETADITQDVIQKVQEFEKHTANINGFIQVINEIASQTNLLSLNASIEAARAGESGRGFSVVADEMKKLAEQSMQAANQIQKIVKEIQVKTQSTVDTAKAAEEIVSSQTVALEHTVKVFDSINEHVKALVNNLNNISSGMKEIEGTKEDTLTAIESISAVSEQTAAASEEVSATALNQINAVQLFSEAALELEDDAKKLQEAIMVFKIE